MPTILITGASGFIGLHVCHWLKKSGWRLLGLARAESVLPEGVERISVSGEWREEVAPVLEKVDAVVHLAGRDQRMIDPAADPLSEYRKGNRDLTLDLARWSLRAGVKTFVFASSVKAMGERPGHYDLNAPPQPTDPYGVSKWEAEQGLGEIFSGQASSRCVVFRFPMVYGPGNKSNMIPLMKAASKGLPLPLGSVTGKRSRIYVGNIASAVETVLTTASANDFFETYFIRDRANLTSGEFYSMICKAYRGNRGVYPFPPSLLKVLGRAGDCLQSILGRDLPVNSGVISRLADAYTFSSEAFEKAYDWEPPFSMEEGVRDTVEWRRAGTSPASYLSRR